MTTIPFIKQVRQARLAAEELAKRASIENSVFKYRIEVCADNLKSIEDTYYEVLRHDSSDDTPYQPQLTEVK